MIKIEDFENAPVGATATRADGSRAMKVDAVGRRWIAQDWVYLDDEEMAQQGYALEPLHSLPTREQIAMTITAREEIAMAIAAYHWDRESGDVEIWHNLTLGEREAVAENYLTWDSADAVLALLKGEEE